MHTKNVHETCKFTRGIKLLAFTIPKSTKSTKILFRNSTPKRVLLTSIIHQQSTIRRSIFWSFFVNIFLWKVPKTQKRSGTDSSSFTSCCLKILVNLLFVCFPSHIIIKVRINKQYAFDNHKSQMILWINVNKTC